MYEAKFIAMIHFFLLEMIELSDFDCLYFDPIRVASKKTVKRMEHNILIGYCLCNQVRIEYMKSL